VTGYVHVYTGDGKGKTTAALGMLLRACGANQRVYLAQFLKATASSEIKLLSARFPDVFVEQFGRGSFIKGQPTQKDIDAARSGLEKLSAALTSGEYDLVIADEANVATALGLIPVAELLKLIDLKPASVELVFTGRSAHERLVERADLVTEMKNIKHYFERDVAARPGVEY